LADVAKDAKQIKAAHAKKPVTDEDIESKKRPLPGLNMEDTDDSSENIEAIGKFKEQLNERETEQAIHNWYDEYDEMLAAAVRESLEMRDQRESTSYHGDKLCQQGVMRDNRMVTGLHSAGFHQDPLLNQSVQSALRLVQGPQR